MTGESRLRVGGWVQESGDASTSEPAVDAAHPVIDAEPVGTVTEAWLPAAMPDPEAGVAGDDDYGPYRGRRRLVIPSQRLRRAAVMAIAVGVTLVGTSVLIGMLQPDREAQLAPPPAPPDRADPSPGSDLEGQRLGPSGSPSPSPTPPPTAPPVVDVSFQAEAAELGSHAQVVTVDGAADGQAVRLSGNRDGTFVAFAVDVVDSGRYELTITYLSEQDRSGTVAVNDGSAVPVSFPSSGGDGAIGSVTVPVELAPGTNTVQIGSDGGAPLTIDQIVLTG